MGGGRLLVMACSARKRDRPLPAINLYDGSAYRVLHKRNTGFARVPVVILSAEHGLILSTRVLSPYDRKMDPERAAQMMTRSARAAAMELIAKMSGAPFSEIFCHGGELYRQVIQYYAAGGVFGDAAVRYSHGAIGVQLSQLARFLSGRG